ncbi:hypothetical protein [Streptomyces sp. NPDC046985]|uniref:hypothetical protein n=1 Tax=Streptomyces sp. NPDC046985 TaxID=3155377 RepID=UPI0033D80EC8
MDRSLPEISPRGLAGLDLVLPALAGIRIALTGGRGNAKFHVPPPDPGLRRYHPGTCQHSRPAAQAATYALLEVFGRVCKKCLIVLPSAPGALWRAAAFTARRREVLDRAEADREPRTWLGYARNAARHEPGDDEQLEQWLDQARTDAALAADADVLAGAWRRLTADHRVFLDAYAADCPEVEAYNGARDAVRRAAGSEQRRALDQVSAAVGKLSRTRERMYGPPPELDAGALVCGVWLAARSRGHSARRAADVAQDAAGAELAGARVVDVTRLPVPPRTTGSAHESPSAWADAELALWWPEAVTDLCTRLEEDFEAESADASSRLLLVRDWPLTGTRDAPVAYLAASPVLGPVVPHGYREVGDYVSWSGGDSAGPFARRPSGTGRSTGSAGLAVARSGLREPADPLTCGPMSLGGASRCGGRGHLWPVPHGTVARMSQSVQSEPTVPVWIDASRLRRRFGLAAWGLAIPAALGSCAALGAAVWAVTDRQALWYVTGLLYLGWAVAMAKWTVSPIRRVRAVRAGIVQHATALTESAGGDDVWEVRRRADEFHRWMVGSRSRIGHRILPVTPATELGKQVLREAGRSTGLTHATLFQVDALARAVAPVSRKRNDRSA